MRLDRPAYAFIPLLLGGVLYVSETVTAQGQVLGIRETFEDDRNLDRRVSSGTWGNFRAVPGILGGDGRHGSFDPRLGQVADPVLSPDVFLWNTDHMVIPGSRTRSGNDETVTDGRFYFTDFFVGSGETVVFIGRRPVQIFVRGQVLINGDVLASAPDVPEFAGRPVTVQGLIPGQSGGMGGPGGGRGGDGGVSGNDGSSPAFDGKDGEDVQLVAGHAYSSRAVGTGGPGSGQFPPTGLLADVTYPVFGVVSTMLGAGGGGGGFVGPGLDGLALQTDSGVAGDLGPPSAVGSAMDLFPILPGTSSLDHFQIGGSGGGGGGSHPFLANTSFVPETWKAGAAGAGGGGALVIRAGHEVRILSSASVQARGGKGGVNTETFKGLPAPGGGGSGGSILVQSGIDDGIVQGGVLDASGGRGGSLFAGGFIAGISVGGDGAPGFIRLETPDGNSDPGATIPPSLAQNRGLLTDRDLVVGSQSLWYSIGRAIYRRYEIEATLDGVPMLFSDDVSVGIPASDPNGPLYVQFQAAKVGPVSRTPTPGSIGPWRHYVHGLGLMSPMAQDSINLDDGDGFRFALLFNKSLAQDIVVTAVSVFYEATVTGTVTYGSSSAGCEGFPVIGSSSEPAIGNSSFGITCDQAPTSKTGVLVLSGGHNATPVRLNGVDVWVDLASPVLATPQVLSDSLGSVRFGLPVPADPSLMGLRLYAQFAWPDICAPGGISASNGLSITVH